jgi:iron complex outermembrane recepter protein
MTGLLRAAIMAASLASAWSAHAKESDGSDIEVRVDIPSHATVVEALNEFALQTGLQLIVPEAGAGVLEKRIPRIRRAGTAREVLNAMLAGLPLRYTFVNERTIAVYQLKEPKVVNLEALNVAQMVITGSRIGYDLRADRSVAALSPSPITTFDRSQLDSLGVSDVAELLRYLPQQPYGPRPGFAAPGAAGLVEMRGLGFDTTLVLINGRRTVPSANTLSLNAFDLNSVPQVAVDRVEVLSDSASAVYGADAIGGVVNIVLKQHIDRPRIDVHYGDADGGATERRVSLSVGHSSDRAHAGLIADYFDRDALLGSERRWANQDYRDRGGADHRLVTSNPGNVRSVSGQNLPGLTASFAAIPVGSTGMGLSAADFAATVGTENKASTYDYWSAVPATRRRGVLAFADYDLTSEVNVFGELAINDVTTTVQTEPSARRLLVPATNPFNPFGTAVLVDYLFSGIGPTLFESEYRSHRIVAGLRGGRNQWNWELSALGMKDKGRSRTRNTVDDSLVSAALSQTDPSRALNVFEDGPGGSAGLLSSLVRKRPDNEYESSGTQTTAVVRGPLARLPAGDLQIVVGAEYMQSDMAVLERSTQIESHRSVFAAFGELRVPLISEAANWPAVRQLSLSIAAREDQYSDFGSTFNPQVGLVWQPIDDLTLRASIGTSFRAPSLFELYTPRTSIPGIPIPDSSRGGQIAPVTFVTGGNPDLDAIEATSLTTGFVVKPEALPHFQATASYWRTRMQGQVRVLPFFTLLANEASFPNRVERGERTAADIAAGMPGVLKSVDISRINFGDVETDGIDIAAKYSFDTAVGRFAQSLAATWVHSYETVDVPGTPAAERVGRMSFAGTIARWRGVATISWTQGAVMISTTARYTEGYADFDPLTGTTARDVSAQTLADVQLTADVGELVGQLPGVTVTVGVSNVFDSEPPFALLGQNIGFDPTQGDLRKRFGYLRLSKEF